MTSLAEIEKAYYAAIDKQQAGPLKVRIYGASTLHQAVIWQGLRDVIEWSKVVRWTARWPAFLALDIKDQAAANAQLFWQHDQTDIEQSELVMLYAEESDELRGALVEAGMALGMGKRVLCVGKNRGFSTWQYHPRVFRTETLAQALNWLRLYQAGR